MIRPSLSRLIRECYIPPHSVQAQGCSPAPLADLIAVAFAEHALLFLPAGNPHSPEDISRAIKDLFDLDFDVAELRQAIKTTSGQGKPRVVRESRRGHLYALTAQRRDALESEIREFAALEDRVYQGWRAWLAEQNPDLDDEDVTALVEDQRLFNKRVLLRYGAQTQLVLCADKATVGSALPGAQSVFSELPPRSHYLSDLREQTLLAFWGGGDRERIRYLAGLLDNACVIHTAHVDPKCSALVRGIFQGTWFYLDTNVVYRLLNLQGAGRFFQMHTLVNVIRRVGGRLLMSQQTLSELRASLRANQRRIRAFPIASVRLAHLAAEATYERDFVSLYFAEYARSQMSLADFTARVRNVDSLLSDLGVHMDEDAHSEILESPELEIEKGSVYLAAPYRILRDEIATHDAFHRLLITKLRRGTPSFARARAWFLTCDGKLGRYDRLRRGSTATGAPFCIYPDHCMQMTRWALPRTEDYDRAFVELVGSPYVSAMGHAARLPSEAAQRICARVDQYIRERGVSEETAAEAAVLTLVDRRLEESFRSPASEEQRIAQVDEAIARALVELDRKTEEATRAKALAHQAALRLASEQAVNKARMEEQAAALAAEGQRRVEAEAQRDRARDEAVLLQETLAKRDSQLEAEKRRAAQAESRQRRIAACLKWAACAALWALVVVVYFVIDWDRWRPPAKLAYTLTASVGCGLALSLPVGFGRVWKVMEVLLVVAGVILGALEYGR